MVVEFSAAFSWIWRREHRPTKEALWNSWTYWSSKLLIKLPAQEPGKSLGVIKGARFQIEGIASLLFALFGKLKNKFSYYLYFFGPTGGFFLSELARIIQPDVLRQFHSALVQGVHVGEDDCEFALEAGDFLGIQRRFFLA